MATAAFDAIVFEERPARLAAASRVKRAVRAPWPVLLLIVSFLCPTEFSLYLGGLRLPPHRIALIILLPWAMLRMIQGRQTRIAAFDIFFLLFNVWTVFVYIQHSGQEQGLTYGGSLALESFGGYIVARAWVCNAELFRATLKALFVAVCVAACFAIPETFTGKLWTHDILAAVTGYHHPVGIEKRLGLTRAYGTFDHPIHYGTFCASLAGLIWFSEIKRQQRNQRVGIIAGATFLGLSSAPLLCLGLQTGLTLWERATRGIGGRVGITFLVFCGFYLGSGLVSSRTPIAWIATGMTLDSWTGYYRLLIWEYGLQNVWANPWIGIGLGDWERPWWMASASVDAFWLVLLMRQGIPALVLLLLAIGLLVRAIATRAFRRGNADAHAIARGWYIGLFALCLVGCTVHFWNVLNSYFFFFLGLGGWLGDRAMLKTMAAGSNKHAERTSARFTRQGFVPR